MSQARRNKLTVLVTGGSGLVGKALEAEVRSDPSISNRYSFIWLASKDADLTSTENTVRIFDKYKPVDYVINLAARVGGLFVNMSDNSGFFKANSAINRNVLFEASRHGVKKCVSCLSTCIFPEDVRYPLDEDKIHMGPPHSSNYGYAMAKRQVDSMNRVYNQDSESSVFTSIIPCNIYGPNDNFSMKEAHVIPGLIHKGYLSAMEAIKVHSKDAKLSVCGNGKALRQFIFAPDLAKLILYVLENYEDRDPIILCPDESEETTIENIARQVCRFYSDKFSISMTINFDPSFPDGQLKKTASNKKLRSLLPEFQFTPLEVGLAKTMNWFCSNYPNVRT